MPSINYFFEDVPVITGFRKRVLTNWIKQVIQEEQQDIEEINYIYCSDNYLLEINQTYLNHDYYTDIITFDNREDLSDPLEADIYISIDRVRENATDNHSTFTDELHRVMIHGIHHLLGQADKTASEKVEMRKKEEASLSLRKF